MSSDLLFMITKIANPEKFGKLLQEVHAKDDNFFIDVAKVLYTKDEEIERLKSLVCDLETALNEVYRQEEEHIDNI